MQYKRNDDFVAPRAVARKSTTRPNRLSQPAPKCVPFLPAAINAEAPSAAGPTSKIMVRLWLTVSTHCTHFGGVGSTSRPGTSR